MSQCGESSRAGGAQSSRIQTTGFNPVGEISGFPLIPCPDCGMARIVEGRTKKDGENHGRMFFKCARNGYPKLCGYYRFEKEYFQQLKDDGVIVVRPSNWADLMEEQADADSVEEKQTKALEQKMDNVIRKLNFVVWFVVCVVLGCVVMSAAIK